MGEIRFVGTGETRGYPYLVCKKCKSHPWVKTSARVSANLVSGRNSDPTGEIFLSYMDTHDRLLYSHTYCISSVIRLRFSPSKAIPKNLDPSCKIFEIVMDLENAALRWQNNKRLI